MQEQLEIHAAAIEQQHNEFQETLASMQASQRKSAFVESDARYVALESEIRELRTILSAVRKAQKDEGAKLRSEVARVTQRWHDAESKLRSLSSTEATLGQSYTFQTEEGWRTETIRRASAAARALVPRLVRALADEMGEELAEIVGEETAEQLADALASEMFGYRMHAHAKLEGVVEETEAALRGALKAMAGGTDDFEDLPYNELAQAVTEEAAGLYRAYETAYEEGFAAGEGEGAQTVARLERKNARRRMLIIERGRQLGNLCINLRHP